MNWSTSSLPEYVLPLFFPLGDVYSFALREIWVYLPRIRSICGNLTSMFLHSCGLVLCDVSCYHFVLMLVCFWVRILEVSHITSIEDTKVEVRRVGGKTVFNL